MAVARARVTDIDLKAWPSVRPGSLATYSGRVRHVRWLLTWQCREPCNDKSSQSCRGTVSLVDGDRQYFCFQATRPEQADIPFFKVQDYQRQLYRYRFFILVFGTARLLKLASAISSSRAWVTGRRNRQCGRSSLSSDFDDVCHCEGKCAERGTSSRNGCRRSCQHGLCCGIRTVRDKDLKTQETHLW